MIIRLLLIACFAFTAVAQTTPVLIPVFYNGPGQFGSQWFTAVNVNNLTSQRIEGHGLRFQDRSCPIPEGCEVGFLDPRGWGSVTSGNLAGGFFLHLPAAEESKFELDARFGERTRNKYGVELPLARANDFVRAPIVLPYVTMTGFAENLRTTLRIYSPDMILGQQVRVELSSFASSAVRGATTVTLNISDPPGTTTPMQPAYAQLDLQSAFPQVFGAAITVRVIPLPSAGGVTPRIWAFATAVRNDNNEVAVFSPR
jgi:hypothetical protein